MRIRNPPMSLKQAARTTVFVYAILTLLIGCSYFPGNTTFIPGPIGHTGPGDLTANPAPGRPGAYTRVCTHDYNLAATDDQWGFARIYVPILDEGQCDRLERGDLVELNRDFNLVVISHADGQGPIIDAHLNYSPLAEHLASHAFIVVSINRYPFMTSSGAANQFRALLDAHLQHLYSSSPVRFSLTDNVALVGHSAGGRSVVNEADIVEEAGRDLRAVVLMAPTVNLNDDIAFDIIADAFLGIHVLQDTDSAAYGSKSPNLPMQSTFYVYDNVGHISSDVNLFTLEKDFVFASTTAGHYFQNEPFALTYINAFLQQHLNGHRIFQRFLKFQERPPSLNPTMTLFQQHQDTTRLTIADFGGSSNQTTNTLGGDVLYGDGGFAVASVQNSSVVDSFSPHDSGVLYLETSDGERTVTFAFPEPMDISGYSHLGFRVTQVYDPDENAVGEPVDITICLSSGCEIEGVSVVNFGGMLTFPAIVTAPSEPTNPEPGVTLLNGQTKNAMRSYLVRLTAFDGLDLTSVEAVELDFTNVGNGKKLIMDDIAFYSW